MADPNDPNAVGWMANTDATPDQIAAYLAGQGQTPEDISGELAPLQAQEDQAEKALTTFIQAAPDTQDPNVMSAYLMTNPGIAAEVQKSGASPMQVAAGFGAIPAGWKVGGNGLVQGNESSWLKTAELAGDIASAGMAGPVSAGVDAVQLANQSVNDKTPGSVRGAVSSDVGAGLKAVVPEIPGIGDVPAPALQAGLAATQGAIAGKTPEQIALASALAGGTTAAGGALTNALGGDQGLTPLEQTALNTGLKTGVSELASQIPTGTTSPTQQIGNTLANSSATPGTPGSQATDPITGMSIPGATYNTNGTIVDSNGVPMPAYSDYSGETTTMPGSGPTSLGTLGSIASQLAPMGSALSSAASAAGNTQRANIDTNSAAQTAYNNGLISRAQLEDTQRQNEAQDVARQSFLTNFTGGSNVTAGGQTGLTPMSPLEQQTLSNLANQGATALSSAPTYSAANMAPLTNYTGQANQTGTSPVGTALSTAGPLLNIGSQLAGLIGKGSGAIPKSTASGAPAPDDTTDETFTDTTTGSLDDGSEF